MLNKLMLIGHLGRDAEIKQTSSGSSVANFSIATTDKWTDKDGQRQERTEWHQIVLWGKAAEAVGPYLKKGKQVYVEGPIQTRKWTDKDGAERKTVEVKANLVRLLSGGGGSAAGVLAAGGSGENPKPPEMGDDPPF